MCTPCASSSAAATWASPWPRSASWSGLWQNKRRASANVKKIAQKHMDELSERIAAMQAMQRSLSTLLHCCHGDDRPDCPILDDLAGDKRTAT